MRVLALVGVFGAFLLASTSLTLAQQSRDPSDQPSERVGRPGAESALQGNDRQLTSIEALFTQIESAKTDADRDKHADDLEARLAAYAKAMVGSFDAAIKQAELAAKSAGKEGSTEPLKAFEDQAVKHENALKQLDNRGQKLLPKSGSISEPAKGGKLALGGTIGDFFISPAEAAIALSVYNPCHLHPPTQPACNTAIANGITQAAAAHTAFNNCWNGLEGVRPKWWRAIRRVGCVVVLTARLA
jgi:hypothetical protein